MRLCEVFVIETLDHELSLFKAANKVEDMLRRLLATGMINHPSPREHTGGSWLMEIGTFKELFSKRDLGAVYDALSSVNIKLEFSMTPRRAVGGEYTPSTRTVTIPCPVRINPHTQQVSPFFKQGQLHTAIIHELRHALDDYLSNYQYMDDLDSSTFRNASDIKDWEAKKPPGMPFTFGRYLRIPVEVGARITQAGALVRHQIQASLRQGIPVNKNLLNQIVLQSMDAMQLVHVFKSERDVNPPPPPGSTFDITKYPFDNKAFRRAYKRLLEYALHLI